MGRIKGKDTGPELFVRKELFAKGFRFRVNDKRYPGTPDIVLPKYNTVVFVHGCFWHGHPNCKRAKLPDTNTEFWAAKIAKNIARDHKNIEDLRALGWQVVVVWDCELRNAAVRRNRIEALAEEIKGGPSARPRPAQP